MARHLPPGGKREECFEWLGRATNGRVRSTSFNARLDVMLATEPILHVDDDGGHLPITLCCI